MLSTIRRFSTTGLALDHARTIINPLNYVLRRASPQSKACLVLSTQSMINSVIEQVLQLHQEDPSIQVAVAAVDSMVGSRRHGVSELWLDEPISVREHELLIDEDADKPLRESDGINVVLARLNWKLTLARLGLSFNDKVNVDVSLTNTLFSTGHLSTLFVVEEGQKYSGQVLKNVRIALKTKDSKIINSTDKWTALGDENEKPLIITKSIGNLVKQINNGSASAYLQDNEKLMSIGSKDTEVYVKLYKKDAEIGEEKKAQRFQVIAGGGGWGAKASTLVISPEAEIQEGDRLEFFMLTPTDKFLGPSKDDLKEASRESGNDIAAFECSYEQETYEGEGKYTESKVIEGIFGGGSESGFKVGNVQHGSAGERVDIQL